MSEELILALFREQTTPWLGIAKEFLESVGSTLMHVFDLAMKEACQDEHIRQAIQGPCESAQLALATTAERDLRRLISREQKGLCTSSPQFNADVFVARSRRLETALRKLVPAGEPTNGLASEGRISQSLLANPTALQGVLQYPRDAVYEVHDLLALYYGYAKQRFQDNVIQLCNEMMLADDGIPLVFTNVWVNGLNEQELSDLCRENARTSARRSDLSEQLRRFEASIEQIGEIIPSLKGTALGRSSASDVSLGQRAYIEYNNGANYGPGSKSMVPRIAPHDEQRMIFNSPLRSSNNGSARTPQAESFNFVPSINGPVGSRYDAAPTMGMVQKPGQRDQRPDPNLTSTYEADSAQRIRNQKTNNQVMATASTTQTAQPHGKNPIAPSIAGNPPFAASAPQNATARPSSSLIQPTTEAAQYLRPNPFEAVTTSSTHFRRASSPRGSRPASSGGRNAATRPSVFAASSPGPSLFEDP